jgi:hypothetical protein
MIRALKQYAYNLLLGLDQMVNVVLLGDPDESLSGRTGRAMMSGQAKWFVSPLSRGLDILAILLTGERDHCRNAVEPEERPKEKELWSWIKP